MSMRSPAAARRYVYAVMISMLDVDQDDLDGWMMGGIEDEAERKLVRAAVVKIKEELRKKAGLGEALTYHERLRDPGVPSVKVTELRDLVGPNRAFGVSDSGGDAAGSRADAPRPGRARPPRAARARPRGA